MEPILAFTKVALPYGWLGNMAPYPVTYEGKTWRTAEALFQALRFEEESIQEAIRREKSPMAAKMVAKRHKSQMVVVPMGAADLDNMRLVLRLKLQAHPALRRQLLATGAAGSSRIAAAGRTARVCSGGRRCGRAGGSGRTGWGGSGRSGARPSASRVDPDASGLSEEMVRGSRNGAAESPFCFWAGEVDRARRSGWWISYPVR